MIEILLFLILIEIKHYLCDFIFQGKYMLGKFDKFPKFIGPLVAHCLVNVLGVAVVVIFFGANTLGVLLIIMVLEFVSHFVIDRVKANKKLLGRWGFMDKQFWWALGFDQSMHHFMYIVYGVILFH